MSATMTVHGGQPVHYVDHGGSGPAVLLLHSFLMDHSMFAPQVAVLGAEFRLIAVDGRGHGGTPADASFDYWDSARDALGLMDGLGIDRAAVVGTSQGGFTAMRMALLAPERIGGLALLGTSARAEFPDVADAYRAIVTDWAANGPGAHVDRVATLSMGDMDASAIKAQWRQVDGAQLVRNMDALVGRDDLVGRLAEIVCPALVMHGSADAAYAMMLAEEMARLIPGAHPLVTIEGGAHYLSLTHADAVNPALRDFLAVVAGPSDQ